MATYHPLLERQWTFNELTLLKIVLALVGCALSLAFVVFLGGWALIVGPLCIVSVLAGGVLLGLARTQRQVTVALRMMIVAGVAGFGPAFYLGPWVFGG